MFVVDNKDAMGGTSKALQDLSKLIDGYFEAVAKGIKFPCLNLGLWEIRPFEYPDKKGLSIIYLGDKSLPKQSLPTTDKEKK